MVPGGPWVLPGGVLSAFGVKNECFSKFEKKCYCPLTLQGVVFVGSSLHYGEYFDPKWYWVGDTSVVG